MKNQVEKTPAYSYYALVLLMFVYILNFLDRTIIYILFPLIKKEMAFSDTQLALLGGYLGQFGWRTAFMLVGFPGILFGVLVFFLREPARITNIAAVEENYSSADWKKLLSNKSFVLLCLGYAFLGLATNNLSIWGATFYSRLHKFDLATIGFWGGILTLTAGIPATLFGGAIADWFRKRFKGGRMVYGALLSLFRFRSGCC